RRRALRIRGRRMARGFLERDDHCRRASFISGSSKTSRQQQNNRRNGTMTETASAYFVIELDITDQAGFDKGYGSVVGDLVAKHGGVFLAPPQKAVPVEGASPDG